MTPNDSKRLIYLDNSATTPVLPAVEEAMRPVLADAFGNPSSAHAAGRRARRALEDARERVAGLLGAMPDEVLFTSGATESNNLALFGLAGDPPGRVIAGPTEHPSVAEPLRQLAQRGFQVEWLPVSPDGVIRFEAGSALSEGTTQTGAVRTALATVQLVNHETGVIQPVQELCRAMKAPEPGLLFHCDATQAVGKLPVDFSQLGVDTLAASAHKFHGPKGIGLLLLQRSATLRPMVFGGHQQQGRRPGTEPVALAMGLASALEAACRQQAEHFAHVRRLRDRLRDQLLAEAAPAVVNGAEPAAQSPYVLNVSFPGVRADVLLMKLDLAGVACSTGSACSSGSLLPSPVLQAMGVPDEVLRSAMRFSFSAQLTEADVHEGACRIVRCVKALRHHTGDATAPFSVL